MLTKYPLQIVFNIIKNFGTILYSIVTFVDCFNNLDGECAGRRIGMFFYAIFNFRTNFMDNLMDFKDEKTDS